MTNERHHATAGPAVRLTAADCASLERDFDDRRPMVLREVEAAKRKRAARDQVEATAKAVAAVLAGV